VGCGVHGLLQESVEVHAEGGGVASVEAEGVLVEVVGRVLDGDVVQGPGDPAFEERGDEVDARMSAEGSDELSGLRGHSPARGGIQGHSGSLIVAELQPRHPRLF